MSRRRYRGSDFIDGLSGLIFLFLFASIFSIYKFIEAHESEVKIFVSIMAACIVVTGTIWIVVRSRIHKRRTAEANERMRQLKIEREKSMRLARKKQLIYEEERRLWEEEKQMDWRKKEKLPADTKLFNVYNTGLYSIYEPDMTDGEVNIVNYILTAFNPHCILVDSYFRKQDGKTTQIDVIAIGRRGIFVFESKDYSGWIFGSGSSKKWTQVLAYGRNKNTFYNPVKQNQSHINALKQRINKHNVPFFSVIVLGSNAEIKKMEYVPRGVFVVTEHRLKDLLDDLKCEQEVLTAAQVLEITRLLKTHRLLPQDNTRDKHASDIRDMMGEDRVYR